MNKNLQSIVKGIRTSVGRAALGLTLASSIYFSAFFVEALITSIDPKLDTPIQNKTEEVLENITDWILGERYHEIERLDDGSYIGRVGATAYLLKDEEPKVVKKPGKRTYYRAHPISLEGFGEFGRLENGRLYGQNGAFTYLLDEKGNKLSEGFHQIKPVGEGYVAYLGSKGFILDRNGEISSSFRN